MLKSIRKLVYFTERFASFIGLRNLRRMRPTPNFPPYVNPEFIGLFDVYKEKTMVSWQGMHDAFNAAQHVKNNQINGDIVECGVWRGGVSALMRDVIEFSGVNLHRRYWLYDTYEGMSPPSKNDFKFGSNKSNAAKKFDTLLRKDGGNDWCRSEIDEVHRTMSISGLPQTNVKLVKGLVEETLLTTVPEEISVLRLDTDFYSSTKIELEILVPRMVTGGILIVDDFGAWAGSKQAVDEYFFPDCEFSFAFFNNHSDGALIGVKIK